MARGARHAGGQEHASRRGLWTGGVSDHLADLTPSATQLGLITAEEAQSFVLHPAVHVDEPFVKQSSASVHVCQP
eukprot:9503993-Pyramimonas_sp.AAC.3